MSEDNKNKDDKEFSFIQEQVASKKKSRMKRMIFSAGWTIILAGIFGIVGAFVFCVSEPAISKLLGIQQDKKTVELSETAGNKTATISPVPTVTKAADKPNNSTEEDTTKNSSGKDTKNHQTQLKPAPVYVEENANIRDFLNIYSELKAVANQVNNSLVTVTSISSGVDWFDNEYEAANTTSGLIVANNGADLLVLVSWDKIKDAKNILVTFSDYLQVKSEIQAYDNDLNLAVITINLKDIPKDVLDDIRTATLGDSYSLIIGTPVLALGSPNGYVGSMEVGMITSNQSSANVTDNKIDLFNTDINYNENGDGVIVDTDGKVIGIITNKLKDDMNQKVSTVIGISAVKEIIEALVNNTNQVYFGIKAVDMPNEALSKAKTDNGIYVTEVEGDSPALKAGLMTGDIIVSVNDTLVLSMASFHNILATYKPKSEIKLTIRRNMKDNYKSKNIKVILEKKVG